MHVHLLVWKLQIIITPTKKKKKKTWENTSLRKGRDIKTFCSEYHALAEVLSGILLGKFIFSSFHADLKITALGVRLHLILTAFFCVLILYPSLSIVIYHGCISLGISWGYFISDPTRRTGRIIYQPPDWYQQGEPSAQTIFFTLVEIPGVLKTLSCYGFWNSLSSEYKLEKLNTKIHHITRCLEIFGGDLEELWWSQYFRLGFSLWDFIINILCYYSKSNNSPPKLYCLCFFLLEDQTQEFSLFSPQLLFLQCPYFSGPFSLLWRELWYWQSIPSE